jgi:hypothetical protein
MKECPAQLRYPSKVSRAAKLISKARDSALLLSFPVLLSIRVTDCFVYHRSHLKTCAKGIVSVRYHACR